MKKKMENLKDLFIEQSQELYDATKQEKKELPKIRKSVKNRELKQVMDRQMRAAENHGQRLTNALNMMDKKPEGEKNECCKAILKNAKDLIERGKDPEVKDAAIISSLQRLNHNKITGLGSLSSYARQMGKEVIANSLHEALEEEKAIDHELSEIAEREVNKRAATATAV